MAEVFTNQFTFARAEDRPTPDAITRQLSTALGQTFSFIFHPKDEHGAPRDWAELFAGEFRVWIYWNPDSLTIEVQVEEPMSRMLTINQALIQLGGQPQFANSVWHQRQTYRRVGKIKQILWLLLAATLIYLAIREWGWWGLAFVLLMIATITISLLLAFSRAMRHHH